jgi:biotin carboxylase
VTCDFSLAHYRELVEAAQAGGYRFAGFEREPREGDLLLRHDVDLSLEAAVRMGQVEAELGAQATYFLMTESVFYNLGSAVGRAAIEELRGLGHCVGLHAVGLRDGIAFPQLLVSDDGVRVVEVAARIPGGQMADLVRHAVGVDLVEVALRQALGEEVPDELVDCAVKQPLAIRFLTAEPGPLPTGRVKRIGPLDPVLAAEGVVQADTYLQVGETIRPVQRDGDRRGYVIAVADTSVEALARAEAAAQLLEVEVETA